MKSKHHPQSGRKRPTALLLSVLFLIAYTGKAAAQTDSALFPGHPGFSVKANAKNLMKDNEKQGLWLEYVDSALYLTSDVHAPYYTMTYYINGIPFRQITGFYRNGNLWCRLPLADGKKNGLQKTYYPDGRLFRQIPYINGVRNGLYKEFFEDGTLKAEYPYTDGRLNGDQKAYFPDGKLNLVITYKNGQAGDTKVFDQNGNEVK